MPRMPTARRPIIETVRAEAQRIRKKQEKALERLARAEKQWGSDESKAPAIQALEDAAALTEREVATLEAGAKVAALLERVSEKDEDEAEAPLTPEAKRAALERLEARGPQPQRREEDA